MFSRAVLFGSKSTQHFGAKETPEPQSFDEIYEREGHRDFSSFQDIYDTFNPTNTTPEDRAFWDDAIKEAEENPLPPPRNWWRQWQLNRTADAVIRQNERAERKKKKAIALHPKRLTLHEWVLKKLGFLQEGQLS